MVLKSDIEWKAWGKHDPYLGVLADPRRAKNGSNPWTDEDFYKNGELTWNICLNEWKTYGVETESCLEIGSGPGRITKQIAEDFKKVYAIDVSEDMINLAKKNVKSPNISFFAVDGSTIPLDSESISSVFSIHVFQHLDTSFDGHMYFKEISRVLRDRGSIMIHIPIYAWPCEASFRRPLKVIKYLRKLRINWRRYLIRNGREVDLMTMNSYPVEYFFRELPKLGFENIKIIFKSFESSEPLSFVLARKKTSRC